MPMGAWEAVSTFLLPVPGEGVGAIWVYKTMGSRRRQWFQAVVSVNPGGALHSPFPHTKHPEMVGPDASENAKGLGVQLKR